MQQVLDFSRQSPLETRPIDLKSLVEETLYVLGRVMPESVDILWEAPPDDYVLKADPSRIHQVIMNLALNARDAMPKGGELRIALSRLTLAENETRPVAGMAEGDWISLTVEDTGTGMSDKALEHLFEPFFTTKAQGEGTGLGLAQVYGIIEQHEGHISVDTERGKGTRFDIYLPAHDGHLPKEGASRRSESMPRGAGETVLVVEDEDGVREACSKALRALGYRTLLVRDGRQALQTIQNGAQVDLVLTDVVMPNMDGLDLMQKLKSVAPSLPVVVMTGYVLDDRIAGIRQNEYVPFLHKPIDRKSLAEIVHIGLRLRREDSE
jgi:CheY-like chemotaxis protein